MALGQRGLVPRGRLGAEAVLEHVVEPSQALLARQQGALAERLVVDEAVLYRSCLGAFMHLEYSLAGDPSTTWRGRGRP